MQQARDQRLIRQALPRAPASGSPRDPCSTTGYSAADPCGTSPSHTEHSEPARACRRPRTSTRLARPSRAAPSRRHQASSSLFTRYSFVALRLAPDDEDALADVLVRVRMLQDSVAQRVLKRHTLASAAVCPAVCPNAVPEPSFDSQRQPSSYAKTGRKPYDFRPVTARSRRSTWESLRPINGHKAIAFSRCGYLAPDGRTIVFSRFRRSVLLRRAVRVGSGYARRDRLYRRLDLVLRFFQASSLAPARGSRTPSAIHPTMIGQTASSTVPLRTAGGGLAVCGYVASVTFMMTEATSSRWRSPAANVRAAW